jgi:hypothetical protein
MVEGSSIVVLGLAKYLGDPGKGMESNPETPWQFQGPSKCAQTASTN